MGHRAAVVLVVAATVVGAGCVQPPPRPSPGTARVSVSSTGVQADGMSGNASISADGRYVAFYSAASNLVPDDANDTWDVFVHDRTTGLTSRVSVASDGAEGDGPSQHPSISADGRYVAFDSIASNLDDGGAAGASGNYDVFVHDRATGTTTLISQSTWRVGDEIYEYVGGSSPSISADGGSVAFESSPLALDAEDSNGVGDVAIADLRTRGLRRLPATPTGAPADHGAGYPSISRDGRFVAFYSASTNLISGGTHGTTGIFVHDRDTRTNELVTVAVGGAPTDGTPSPRSSISANGRFVAFSASTTNLVADDTNGAEDVFVRDRESGTTVRVSLTSSGGEIPAAAASPDLSADGRFVLFSSAGTFDPLDTNGATDLYLRDRQTGRTSRISVATGGTQGDRASGSIDAHDQFAAQRMISDDGRFVAFSSSATNLVGDDTNEVADLFVRDRTG